MRERILRKLCEARAERLFDDGDGVVGWLCAAIGAVAFLEWVLR